MSERIKEEIKKFKAENGNANFTNKEMLWYLISKVDNVVIDTAATKSSLKVLWKIVLILLTAAVGTGGYALFG